MIKYCLAFLPFLAFGQSFAPEPGVIGSTAMHKDSSAFIAWATGVNIVRGPQLIINSSFGYATHGIDSDALGPATGTSVVSLGDGGEAILTFSAPISNGAGPDFAIFENGFIDHYLELGFVEVSSDGINYTRFEAVSEIQTDVQLTNFDTVNCRYVHNFAGKYRVNYGTPFDLEELNGTPGLDINNITHVKIIDAVGFLDVQYGTYDSQGTLMNDPYPTMFDSGGFDLDAVGVIHSEQLGVEELEVDLQLYPNPTSGVVKIDCDEMISIDVFSTSGQRVRTQLDTENVDLSQFDSGIYFFHIHTNSTTIIRRIVKQ